MWMHVPLQAGSLGHLLGLLPERPGAVRAASWAREQGASVVRVELGGAGVDSDPDGSEGLYRRRRKFHLPLATTLRVDDAEADSVLDVFEDIAPAASGHFTDPAAGRPGQGEQGGVHGPQFLCRRGE